MCVDYKFIIEFMYMYYMYVQCMVPLGHCLIMMQSGMTIARRMGCPLNMEMFCTYWTEVMKNGGKQLWLEVMQMMGLRDSFPAKKGAYSCLICVHKDSYMYVCAKGALKRKYRSTSNYGDAF